MLYTPKHDETALTAAISDPSDRWLKMMEENAKELDRLDAEAKAAGRLVGRVVRHQVADGYATYQIVKETARTVRVRHCTGFGDDYVFSLWGREATEQKSRVLPMIQRADALARMFAAKAGR